MRKIRQGRRGVLSGGDVRFYSFSRSAVLAYMPVETIVRNRQVEYYASLGQADAQGEATKFMEFMLQALHDTWWIFKPTK